MWFDMMPLLFLIKVDFSRNNPVFTEGAGIEYYAVLTYIVIFAWHKITS